MKHIFYSAVIGLSALALNTGAMAENYSSQDNPQANVQSQSHEQNMGANDNYNTNNYEPDSRPQAAQQDPNEGMNERNNVAQDNNNAPTSSASDNVKLSQADITQTQRALKDEGFKVSVDGIWGPMTANAIAQFQQQNELPVTGHPDTQTLAALNIEANDNR